MAVQDQLVFVSIGLAIFFVEELHVRTWCDGRNCVLVYQLRWASIAAQQHTKVVEPSHHALQLDAIHKENCQWSLGLTDCVKESILEVLLFI